MLVGDRLLLRDFGPYGIIFITMCENCFSFYAIIYGKFTGYVYVCHPSITLSCEPFVNKFEDG
jgi:hypothetical protein